jgi:hypothetical protein
MDGATASGALGDHREVAMDVRLARVVVAAGAVACMGCAKVVGDGDGVVDDEDVPAPGWEAVLEGHHHDVSGTAVIVDDATIEIRDFHYDGGGINARVYLLADGEAFHRDWELTDNLVGEPFDGETLVLEIPDDAPFADWNLLTLWCVPAAVSFGDGLFRPPE